MIKKHSPLAALGVAAILATSFPGAAHAQGLDPAPPPLAEITTPPAVDPTEEPAQPVLEGDITAEVGGLVPRGALITAPIDQTSIDAYEADPLSRTATLTGPNTTVVATITSEGIQARLPSDAPSGTWTLSLLGPAGEVLDAIELEVSAVVADMEDAYLGSDLSFTGSGFVPGSKVAWVIKDADGKDVLAGDATAASTPDGAVTEKIALSIAEAAKLGAWTVTLTDSAGNTSTASSNVSFDDSQAKADVSYDAKEDSFVIKLSGIRPGAWGSLAALSGDIDLGGTSLDSSPTAANAEGELTFRVPANSAVLPIHPDGATDILWKVVVKALDNLGYESDKLAESEVKTPSNLGTYEDQSNSPLFIDKNGEAVTWVDPPSEPIDPPEPPKPIDPPVKPVDPPLNPELPVDPPTIPVAPPVKPLPPVTPPAGGSGNNNGAAPIETAPPAVAPPVNPLPPAGTAPVPEVDEAAVQKLKEEKKQAEEQERIENIFANSSLEAQRGQGGIAGAELPRRSSFFEDTVNNLNQQEQSDANLASQQTPENEDTQASEPSSDAEESQGPVANGGSTPGSTGDNSSATAPVEKPAEKGKLGIIAMASALGLAVLGGLGWLIFAWRRKKTEDDYKDDEVNFSDAFDHGEAVT